MNKHKDLAIDIKGFLRQIPLFKDVSEESLMDLLRFAQVTKWKKGQFIFHQSDLSEKFYVILSGQISILLGSSDGREMIINELHKGDFFGELGIITKQPRSTSALVHNDCELIVFPSPVFLKILEAEPFFTRKILETTAIRLRSSSKRESALAFLNAQARLAQMLLQLDKEEIEKGYITISQEELAQRTGLTRQTVAKTLGYWRRAGWIITGRGHILVLRHEEFSKLEKEWLV